MNTSKTRAAVGGALLAGGMLLSGPAAMAFAIPAPSDPSSTPVSNPTGVGGRPGLAHPAPGVEGIQTAGDKVFNENNSYLDGTSLGKAYHGIYGRSEADANAQDPSGHAVQGLSVGVLNQAPRILGCNIVVTKYCHVP
jgi:hypothetical protein